MENGSAAFLDAVRRSMRGIRTAIGVTTINPTLLTSAERLRYQGYLRRQDAQGAIAALVSNKVPVPIVNPIRWQLIENRAMLLLDV